MAQDDESVYLNPGHSAPDRPLGPAEKAFLGYERAHPGTNLGIGGLVLFHGKPPTMAEIYEQAPLRLPEQPLMGCGLTPGSFRQAAWRPRPTLDLTRHCRERILPAGSGRAALLGAVNELLALPFTQGDPPWRLWIIHGYDDDEFAGLYLGHHALHDGVSAMKNVGRLMFGERPETVGPRIPRGTGRPRPLRAALGACRLASGLFPPAMKISDTALTGERRLAWATTSLELMREIGKRHDTTVNTVYLAALTTALREWPDSPWHELQEKGRPLWALVPVSTRAGGEHGDTDVRIAPERGRLPCAEPDPVRRLAILKDVTEPIRASTAVDSERMLRTRIPRWLSQFVLSQALSPRTAHLLATNVPGIRQPCDALGRPVREIVPLSFLPAGQRLAVALTCYRDRACAGFMVDSGHGDAADELAERWCAAIEELRTAVPAPSIP
ncbi:wax ester/triacylglycerol synthase domain-containing protein [Thermomonospora umbrina]|uniref:diacylglycerol O-acyltransferase n=1 Tax=Thermomonospora umbrina TaxID=111806 RepID=A0A3D9SH27_9ACTN|nr:wax ester/triacylglycerol synthase domain-containing protein [Thermomonospora umbrina]REE95218.1 diacylglycerol O-acyltransferase [Thermomonospora umbrina]